MWAQRKPRLSPPSTESGCPPPFHDRASGYWWRAFVLPPSLSSEFISAISSGRRCLSRTGARNFEHVRERFLLMKRGGTREQVLSIIWSRGFLLLSCPSLAWFLRHKLFFLMDAVGALRFEPLSSSVLVQRPRSIYALPLSSPLSPPSLDAALVSLS